MGRNTIIVNRLGLITKYLNTYVIIYNNFGTYLKQYDLIKKMKILTTYFSVFLNKNC